MFYRNWLLESVAVKIVIALFGLITFGSLTSVAEAHAGQGDCFAFQKTIRPQVVIATFSRTGSSLLRTYDLNRPLAGMLDNVGRPASLRDGDSGDKDHDHADGDKGDKDHGQADGDKGDKDHDHADGDKGDKGDKDHHDGDDDGDNN